LPTNCELTGRTWWDENGGALRHDTWLTALNDISRGDELTIDYAWPATSAIPYLYGSAQCRGWIVARDQLRDVDCDSALSRDARS
jgi:hypothetical protein